MAVDFRELQYVMAIYEEGNITRAAQRLHISQPSLSKFLSVLEKEEDCPIFDRSTAPITLTEYGEKYVTNAQTILNLSEDLKLYKKELQDMEVGTLRVGVTVAQALLAIPRVLPLFSARYKGVRVSVTEGKSSELKDRLLRGKLDFIIMDGPTDLPQITNELLKNERFYLVTPPGYLPEGPRTFEFALQHLTPDMMKFVLLHHDQRFRVMADAIFSEYGIVPHVEHVTQMSTAAVKLCVAGMGMTFVSSLVKNNFLCEKEPDYYIMDGRFVNPVMAAYRKNGYLPRSARPFIDLFKECLSCPEIDK